MVELWDEYSKNREKTGKVLMRGEKLLPGQHHLVVYVCIFNPQGQLLIQQRQNSKEYWPNMWDLTAGGSAIAGETSDLAAHRELLEELGLDIDFAKLRPSFSINDSLGFFDYYLITASPDISALRLQPEEVQAVKWADKEQVLQIIKSGEFMHYRPAFIDFLFDMKDKQGVRAD